MAALPPPPRGTATRVLPHALPSIPATTIVFHRAQSSTPRTSHCFSSSTEIDKTPPLFDSFSDGKFIIFNFFSI
jgi:hypothetical protein